MEKKLDNIYLIGPMGAGKTTIGRLLAQSLKYEFVDSDQEIEARSGADIAWIFDVEGEKGFRLREQKMIAELTRREKIVLATGGGAVLAPKNRKSLSEHGTVIYLMTSVSQQLDRTRKDQKRPLLQNLENPRQRMTELMNERDPLYREIADHIIVTGRRSPKTVSSEILQIIKAGIRD